MRLLDFMDCSSKGPKRKKSQRRKGKKGRKKQSQGQSLTTAKVNPHTKKPRKEPLGIFFVRQGE